MKKTFLSLLCLAAAAMTFTACSDVEEFEPNRGNGRDITFIASNPDVDESTRACIGTDGNGKLIPMWTENDYLTLYSDNAVKIFLEMNKTNLPAATATFRIEDDPEHMFNKLTDFYIVRNVGNDTFDSGKSFTFELNPSVSLIMANDNFSINDILVSEKLTKTEGQKVFNVRLKRLTGVINMKFTDATENSKLNGEVITKIYLNSKDDNFIASEYKYDLENGTGEKIKPNGISVNTNCAFGGNGMHFSTLPVSLAENSEILLKVRTNNYTFTKKVKVGKDGFKVEAGKRTTINVSLKDAEITDGPIVDPEPDSAIDPTIEGNVVTMKQKGRLTSKMVVKAIGSGSSVKIVGDINAFDWNSVLKVVNGTEECPATEIEVDLSEANIKADGSKFNNGEGKQTFSEDNTLPRFFINNQSKLAGIILPKTLLHMNSSSISTSSLKKLVFLNHYEHESITNVYLYSPCNVYFLYEYKEEYSGFLTSIIAESSTAIFPESWIGKPLVDDMGRFANHKFIDKDGNIVTEGGTSLPDVTDNGNVL